MKTLVAFGVLSLLFAIIEWCWPAIQGYFFGRHTWIMSLPKTVQVLMALVLGDLIGYWGHRLFHGRTLWKFHAVHHASVELDPARLRRQGRGDARRLAGTDGLPVPMTAAR